MNKHLRRLSLQLETVKRLQPKQECTSWAKLPPDAIIRDWLKKDRQKREKKEQPTVDLPLQLPEDRTEEKDRDGPCPIIIPILEKDDKDLN